MNEMTVTVYRVDPDKPDQRIAEQVTLKEAMKICATSADELKQIKELTEAKELTK